MFKEKKGGLDETYVGVQYELPNRLKQKQQNLDKQLEQLQNKVDRIFRLPMEGMEEPDDGEYQALWDEIKKKKVSEFLLTCV